MRCSSVAKTSIGLPGCFAALLGNGVRAFFLNAAASSGEADFGFFGRGAWIGMEAQRTFIAPMFAVAA
jgi:hypothetical protein